MQSVEVATDLITHAAAVKGVGPSMTWLQFWSALGGVGIPAGGAAWAVWLKYRRKAPKEGAQDAVYEVNRETILDLRSETKEKDIEIDALRRACSEFEGQLISARANLRIAEEAAATASRAAASNFIELEKLQQRWLALRGHVHTLHATLAENGIPIPPLPAASA